MKRLFIFLILVCVGFFVPKNTFALQVYNNVNIDYRFFVDEDESDSGNLHFRLYDKSGDLSFDSKYDTNTKQYYFEYDENTFYKETHYVSYYDYYTYWWRGYNWNGTSFEGVEDNYRGYVHYVDELNQKMKWCDSSYCYYDFNESFFNSFLQQHNLNGLFNSIYGPTWTYYTFVPMIIENAETGVKKIVFASLNVRDGMFVHVMLVNNTKRIQEDPISLGDSFLENVDFMRKTTLNYSDELWEELNNDIIASTEISTNNKASAIYKYVNQSIIDGNRNVPEETLEDYANSLPVLSFKKTNNIDDDNNIVKVLTNPKTWTNGMIILVISMIIIIGSSFIWIKKKNN